MAVFESRGVALAVVLAVVTLIVGYVLGQATAPASFAPPEAVDERPTAAEAKARSGDSAFKEAQIAGLTARLGKLPAAWDTKNTPPRELPAAFYAKLRESRTGCGVQASLVGVECSEPPCIGLLRQTTGDVPATLAACVELTSALPAPRIETATATCASGKQETVVFVSPAARADRGPDVAALEDARLAERHTAIVAGWPCSRSVADMAD